MKYNLANPSDHDFNAHENSSQVERAERLRAAGLIVLSFVAIGILFFYYGSRNWVEPLFQKEGFVIQGYLERQLIAIGILLLLTIFVIKKWVKAMISFGNIQNDKRKAMIQLLSWSILNTIIWPVVIYISYLILKNNTIIQELLNTYSINL